MTPTKWIGDVQSRGDIIDTILASRGITNKELFLNGTIEDIPSGLLLNDAEKAIFFLRDAIKSGKKIGLYPDYDADGIGGGSTALLMLRELGANVFYYTNNRFSQGYGMAVSGVEEMLAEHPDMEVILTIDNGIAAHEAIEFANSKGLTVIVTDHHDPTETLPPAYAVINPKRKDSTYPFPGICGAVVVWKLLRELYKNKDKANEYLDILAISTVGDVVPLLEENRIIVREGLKLLKEEKRLSLRILKEMTKTSDINSHFTLAFIYVPIFNATGRLDGDVNKVIDFLTSTDEDKCREIITELINTNEERKSMTEAQVLEAEDMLSKKEMKKVIVLFNETFHEGIVGLIAGRLKEKYNRPTIILTRTESGTLKGSARSIEGFHLKENLDKCSDLLLGYGGHSMAAGLGLEEKNLHFLEERINKIADSILTEDDLIKKLVYVGEISEGDMTLELIDNLDKLEPYGAGFPKPLLKLNEFNVKRCFFMGKDNIHLKLLGEKASLIAWRQAKMYEESGSPLKIHALGYPAKNIYNNQVSVQFLVEDNNFKEA